MVSYKELNYDQNIIKVPVTCHLFIQFCITEKILGDKPSLYIGQRICKDVDSLYLVSYNFTKYYNVSYSQLNASWMPCKLSIDYIRENFDYDSGH